MNEWMLFVIYVITIVAILIAFKLGAQAHRQGTRVKFYADKEYYPPEDVKPKIDKEAAAEDKKEVKDWDGEV